jgi:hypothetical protein
MTEQRAIAREARKRGVEYQNMVPITQDASASAYQIVLYLLLNEELAMRTNLIKSPYNKIISIYTDIKS